MNTTDTRLTNRTRLDAIEDEVKQLHPLLNLLLPKMPRVQHVEYTHGQHEMGADFVLSRQDDMLPDVDYVGVISKLGKIVQDYSDIERQIKECEVERLFNNGRKKIFLTEIWVVATGIVSPGAQQKIHAAYKTRKVIFIDRDRLIGLIDHHLPNYWTDVSLELGDYLHNVWTTNDQVDKSMSLIAGHNDRFYVEQDLFEAKEFDKRTQRPPEKVNIHDEISRQSVVLIEGDMGSGKSKLLRNLVDYYSTPQWFLKHELLPVPVSFKDFVDKFESNPEKVVESSVPPDVRKVKPENVKYLLLIDGVDEKDLPAERLAEAVVLAAKAIDGCKMKGVITSRWCEAFEKNSPLRQSAKRVELHPLSINRLIEFIQKLCRAFDLKSRLVEDLKGSALFKDLPRSPIAAILLAQLFNENAKDLPSNLTELYAKYTELSLGRWDVDKGLETLKEFEALSSIINDLAEHFLDNQLEQISIGEAKGFFDSYLKRRNLGLNADALFKKFVSRCDIVFVDQQRGVFRFKHKTFLEFFYAKAYSKKSLLIDGRVWKPYWVTSFYFYVGLQKDCPATLDAIIGVKPRNEGERWMRLIHLPNYLLAGFSSPYEIAEAALTRSMLEAAELYLDVAKGKVLSPFSVFPRLHFLWMMQMMVRKGFGFEFFKRAIAYAALQIGEECSDRKRCGLAVFFLSVISEELEEKDCFDFLLENYQKDLSLEVELGIRHETKDHRQRSQLIKKMDQRVGRALKASPPLRQFVLSLYEKPMRTNTLPEGKNRVSREGENKRSR